MPINDSLPPVKLPMTMRFGEKPTTEFKNNLRSLRIELVDAPDPATIRKAVYCFVRSTWADQPLDISSVSDRELSKTMEDVFAGRALPAAQEMIGLTFLMGGIDLQTVTHLIRHRAGTFAAQCTGDRFLHHEPCLVPSSVENSPEFYQRWKQHVEDSKQLYADMVDSQKISMMDARLMLPKCLETFYYMRMNAGELLRFIKQRQDQAIQPEIDNAIAAHMAIQFLKIFPEAHVAINLEEPSWHYIKTFRHGTGTNLYYPNSQNDTFEYNSKDTIYPCTRDEMNGTDPDSKNLFRELWSNLMIEYKEIVRKYKDANQS